MSCEKVVNLICRLGECPVWHTHQQCLYWTDIIAGKIWRYDPVQDNAMLFWEGGLKVGGFAFTPAGYLVLCGHTGVYLLHVDAHGNPCAAPEPLYEGLLRLQEAFNDITTDPCGRIFAGTDTAEKAGGVVYRLEQGKAPEVVMRGLDCSNGMAFSMDERRFYHVNTGARQITCYDYDRESGAIVHPRLFYQGDEAQGVPDGMTIDRDDHLWVAFWGAACLRRFDPQGAVTETIPVPARHVTSVIFGGAQMNELYVTSSGNNRENPQRRDGYSDAGDLIGGPVYRIATGVTGRPEWPARF